LLLIATIFNLPLSLGVVGHEGSTVVVAFNGLRMLWQPLEDWPR
jgi:Cd2+/Zn2+-exporting ATPase